MPATARPLAFDILRRTAQDAWAAELLAAHTALLDEREAGLATELVLGCLRHQAQLDYLIAYFSGRPVAKLDLEVRIALRLGLYQLRYLERIPRHAAVDESVKLVRRAKKASAAGFVNAVLRKAGREPVQWPDRPTACSQPAWLLERWDAFFGQEVATGVAQEFLRPPQIWVRHPPPDSGAEWEPASVPGSFRLVEGNARGMRIQDIGSQSIVPLLGLEPGMTFLDLCAAPGNKTAQALEYGVRVVACDLHLHRLARMTGCDRAVLDATRDLPFVHKFDRILVDAPCSGTGTLGRNPEIRWQLQPSDLLDLQNRQTRILRSALTALRPGGKLVYSTCSLEPEENEHVAGALPPGWKVLDQVRRTPGQQPGDGFYAAVITSS